MTANIGEFSLSTPSPLHPKAPQFSSPSNPRKLPDGRDQPVQILRRRIYIGRYTYPMCILPGDIRHMYLILFEKITVQFTGCLSFNTHHPYGTTETRFHRRVEFHLRNILPPRHPVILQVEQSLLLPCPSD